MNKLQITLTDLPFDMLRHIMIFVAKSSDGAANFARAKSVSKLFMNVAEDRDVLRAIVFDDVKPSYRYGLFQHVNGLFYKCACAGNVAAQCMLAKEILVSSNCLKQARDISERKHLLRYNNPSKIIEEAVLATSFLDNFMVEKLNTNENSQKSLTHFELVRLFFCKCNPDEIFTSFDHFYAYVLYFVGEDRARTSGLMDGIGKLFNSGLLFVKFKWLMDDCRKVFKPEFKINTVVGFMEELKAKRDVNETLFDFKKRSNATKCEFNKFKLFMTSLEEASRKSVPGSGGVSLEVVRECFKKMEKEIATLNQECRASAIWVPESRGVSLEFGWEWCKKMEKEIVILYQECRANAICSFDRIFPLGSV